jgi:hypothetical protein
MEVPKFDKHKENWCGYFKNQEEAKKHFDEQLDHLKKDFLIVSANMQFGNVKLVHGLSLYKFFVVTADKK